MYHPCLRDSKLATRRVCVLAVLAVHYGTTNEEETAFLESLGGDPEGVAGKLFSCHLGSGGYYLYFFFKKNQFWGNLYHIHHTKMVTREEVGRWWLDKNTKPDPRGQSPNILCVYNYKVQKWMTVMEMMKKKINLI